MKIQKLSNLIIPRSLPGPRGLLLRAGALVGFLVGCHLAGWREATMVLSGTRMAGVPHHAAALRAGLYIVAYLGVTVVVPVLMLGALILIGLNHMLPARPMTKGEPQ